MTDVGRGLKRNINCQQAKKFYAKMELLTPRVFDEVNWEALDRALKVKPKMYNVWYGKQCPGWCATNYKLKQWKKRTTHAARTVMIKMRRLTIS